MALDLVMTIALLFLMAFQVTGDKYHEWIGKYSMTIDQGNLTTQPGQYRETTVAVDSFSPNPWGLYNMHGNVSEWVWDYYGEYDIVNTDNPTGAVSGTLKVYRGGGWNDFAKNMRSAYRATLEPDLGSFNIGIRLVRNAVNDNKEIIGTVDQSTGNNENAGQAGKVLIVFFSWSGNTKGIAEEIQSQTAITKLEPDAKMGKVLSVHYSGEESLNSDIENWLKENKVMQ